MIKRVIALMVFAEIPNCSASSLHSLVASSPFPEAKSAVLRQIEEATVSAETPTGVRLLNLSRICFGAESFSVMVRSSSGEIIF